MKHPAHMIGVVLLILAGALTPAGAVDSKETPPLPETPVSAPDKAKAQVEIRASFLEIPESSVPGHLLREITESSVPYTRILSEERSNAFLGRLCKTGGAEFLVLPHAKVHSGQTATVDAIKEFKYPIEYNPPEKHGTKVPTPTAFDEKAIGPSLEAQATIAPGGKTLGIAVTAKVVDLAGVIHYSKEGTKPLIVKSRGLAHAGDAIAETAKIYGNLQEGVCQPVFPMWKMQTSLDLWPGQSVVLGGIKPAPEDELLKKKSERRFIFVFVNTQIVGGTQKALSQAAQ